MLKQLRSFRSRRHRQLFHLSGNVDSGYEQIKACLAALGGKPDVVWAGSNYPHHDSTPRRHILTEIGREHDFVVFDATKTFDPDLFAALCGTLKAGGAIFLLSPPVGTWLALENPFDWHHQNTLLGKSGTEQNESEDGSSRYLRRLLIHLIDQTEVIAKSRDSQISALQYDHENHPLTTQSITTSDNRRSIDQEQVIESIKQRVQDQSGVLLLTADRGRGKSAALGMAAAELISQGRTRIALIAPTARTVAILNKHYQQMLDALREGPDREESGIADSGLPALPFYPPDQISNISRDSFDLILVDEAASIPLRLLLSIAETGLPVVYASTVDGYEGAGRGFALRFTEILSRKNIPTTRATLIQPIRWSPNDPLEKFVNKALMLDTNPFHPPTPSTDFQPHIEHLTISEIDRDSLMENEPLLHSIFTLLVQSHYRTTPKDLFHLLDGPNLRIFTGVLDNILVAAALVAHEGPVIGAELRQGIVSRKRRPAGHLLPQLLAQYSMSAAPLDMNLARVVRIAVHPNFQRRGLGIRLLDRLPDFYTDQDIDAIGAMFGGVPETVRFWEQAGFSSCHLGQRAQTSIGYRSVSVFKALSSDAIRLLSFLEILHNDKLIFEHLYGERALLEFELSSMESDSTLANSPGPKSPPTLGNEESLLFNRAGLYDPFVLQSYCKGARSLNDSRAAIYRFLHNLESQKKSLTEQKKQTSKSTVSNHTPRKTISLKTKTLQPSVVEAFLFEPGASLAALAVAAGLNGKRAADRNLKASIASLLPASDQEDAIQ